MSRIAIEQVDDSRMPHALARQTPRIMIVFWLTDVPVRHVIDEGPTGELVDLEGHWQALGRARIW